MELRRNSVGVKSSGSDKTFFFFSLFLLFIRQTILAINYAAHGLWTLISPRRRINLIVASGELKIDITTITTDRILPEH